MFMGTYNQCTEDDLETETHTMTWGRCSVMGRANSDSITWMEKRMAQCDCCGRDKPDVRIRIGLRGQDPSGSSTTKPFHVPFETIVSRVLAECALWSSAGYFIRSCSERAYLRARPGFRARNGYSTARGSDQSPCTKAA